MTLNSLPDTDRTQTWFHAESMGSFAHQILSIPVHGKVMGITSKGVFIWTPPHWVLFVSSEAHHGPFTINLSTPARRVSDPTVGDPVGIAPGLISFLRDGTKILTEQAEIWQANPLPATSLSAGEQFLHLQQVCARVYQTKQGAGFSHLIPAAAGIDQTSSSEDPFEVSPVLSAISWSLTALDLHGLAASMRPLFGLGSGLTPSGDDVIMGLVLTLHRIPALYPGMSLQTFDENIISLAYQKTTTLSANLIEAACASQADERLLRGMDGILTGNLPVSECAAAFSSWGNSSGADALLGLALVIRASAQVDRTPITYPDDLSNRG